MFRSCALVVAILPLAAQAGQPAAKTAPVAAPAGIEVNLECTVQPDMTVKGCMVTNADKVAESDAMDAIHAVEARSDPVPSGKPGDKVKIVMKLAQPEG